MGLVRICRLHASNASTSFKAQARTGNGSGFLLDGILIQAVPWHRILRCAALCGDGAGCTGATSHCGQARASRGSTAGQPPLPTTPEPELVPPKRAPAHYLWAVLIARTYEVFPLLCPLCGGQMRGYSLGIGV